MTMRAQDASAGMHDKLVMLEQRQKRLTRTIWVLAAVLAITVLVDSSPLPASADPEPATRSDSVLRIRELVIVDPNGTDRVRIAAPLPDPIMLGRRSRRGDPVSGIIIYDAEGNERGGYVTGDVSRGAAITLDEVMRAAVHIAVEDRGEAHVSISNGTGGFGRMGVTMNTGGFLGLGGSNGTVLLGDTTPGVR